MRFAFRLRHGQRLAAAAGFLATSLLLMASSAQAAILITVDKSTQRMSVEVNGVPTYDWPVSTGKRGHDTPSGAFRAFRMEEDHYSKEWDDAPMPNSIFFTQQGHAIHGSYAVKNIGTPASHGCVRLEPQNAKTLFQLVKADGVLNTRVVLTGEIPSGSGVPVARRAPQGPAMAEGYGYTDSDRWTYNGNVRARPDTRYQPYYERQSETFGYQSRRPAQQYYYEPQSRRSYQRQRGWDWD